jgi:hypothetical protein
MRVGFISLRPHLLGTEALCLVLRVPINGEHARNWPGNGDILSYPRTHPSPLFLLDRRPTCSLPLSPPSSLLSALRSLSTHGFASRARARLCRNGAAFPPLVDAVAHACTPVLIQSSTQAWHHLHTLTESLISSRAGRITSCSHRAWGQRAVD